MNVEENSLDAQIKAAVNCRQLGICIRSHEPDEAISRLLGLSGRLSDDEETRTKLKWDVILWNCVDGPIQIDGKPYQMPQSSNAQQFPGQSNRVPLATFAEHIRDLASHRDRVIEEAIDNNPNLEFKDLPIDFKDLRNRVFVIQQADREIAMGSVVNKELLMTLQLLLTKNKGANHYVVLLCTPDVTLPPEIRELFWVIDHELPQCELRKELVNQIVEANSCKNADESFVSSVADATGGLTSGQIEAVLSRSLSRNGKIDLNFVGRLKAEVLDKEGLLTLHRGREMFETYRDDRGVWVPGVGGLEGIKRFCVQAIRNSSPLAQARGVLLTGVSGTGKSALAKALGNETGRPTIRLNLGALMGRYVGDTEAATRRALKMIDAMSPCIVFADELEKQTGGTGSLDGGVGVRMMGELLQWLNDHTSEAFFIGTCNSIDTLPTEFMRSERLDATFFLDLPTRLQKNTIWAIYCNVYGIPMTVYNDREHPNPEIPVDVSWTGAEVKTCCRLARLLDVPLLKAAESVIPITQTRGGQIESLRKWAHNKCLDAETGLAYVWHEHEAKDQPKSQLRKVVRKVRSV